MFIIGNKILTLEVWPGKEVRSMNTIAVIFIIIRDVSASLSLWFNLIKLYEFIRNKLCKSKITIKVSARK